MRIDSGLFRRVLRRHAAAVVVVTAADPGSADGVDVGNVGFTATSFASVSIEPPLVSFNVASGRSAWPPVRRAGLVAVHVLSAGQERIARTFATPGVDRFAAYAQYGSWHAGPGGVPVLDDVLAVLVCRVVNHVEAGDHVIVVASPEHAEHHDDESARPLIYHEAAYKHLMT